VNQESRDVKVIKSQGHNFGLNVGCKFLVSSSVSLSRVWSRPGWLGLILCLDLDGFGLVLGFSLESLVLPLRVVLFFKSQV